MEVVSCDNWTTGAISRAKLQSDHHHQQTDIQFLTGWMPFLSPNNSVKALKEKISHSMDLLTPSSPGGLPTLSLTTNSSWLPWGGLPCLSSAPLMSVLPWLWPSWIWNPWTVCQNIAVDKMNPHTEFAEINLPGTSGQVVKYIFLWLYLLIVLRFASAYIPLDT